MSLLRMSSSVAIMICMVLIFRRFVGKKISKGTVLMLWNLVLIKALIPYQFPVEGLPALKDSGDRVVHSDAAVAFTRLWSGMENVRRSTANYIQTERTVKAEPEVLEYAMWIWAAGVVCFLFYFFYIYIKEYKALKKSRPIRNSALDCMASDYGFRRRIRLYRGEVFETPVTYGILFPKILLPVNGKQVSRLDMRNMFAHELEHIRKFDVGKRYLMVLVLCLHWFNPMVWVMYRAYQEDQEIACDERVMRKMGNKADNYIYTLIKMSTAEKSLFTTTTGFGGKNTGKKRILETMYKKRRVSLTAFLVGVCLLLPFFAFVNRESGIEQERQAPMWLADRLGDSESEVRELIEPRFDEVNYFEELDEDFDYQSVLLDIEENYNDLSQPLTPDQEKALTIQNCFKMVKIYKRIQAQGNKLSSDQIWLMEEYFKMD